MRRPRAGANMRDRSATFIRSCFSAMLMMVASAASVRLEIGVNGWIPAMTRISDLKTLPIPATTR